MSNKNIEIVEVDADDVDMNVDDSSSSSDGDADQVISGAHLFFYENPTDIKKGRQITITDLFEGELKIELLGPLEAGDDARPVLQTGNWIVRPEKRAAVSASASSSSSWSIVGPEDLVGIKWDDEDDSEIAVSYDENTKTLTYHGVGFLLMGKAGPTKLQFG